MKENNYSAQSEHQQGPTTSSIKPTKKCMVCDTACSYHYYGVQSCEGCKQFFRRSVVKQKIFHCWKDKQCDITKANRCRGCRLDRCLLVGMDPLLINAESTQSLDLFIETLENRRTKLLSMHGVCQSSSNLNAEGASDSGLMNTLHFLGKCHYRIWASNTPFNFASLNSSSNIQNYLEDPNHILAKADEFSDNMPSFWNSERFRAEVEVFGFSSPKHIKIITKDHFLAMEFAKVVLSFNKLDIDDQALIIKDLIEPIFMFFNSFYASCMNAAQWTTSEGLTLGTMLTTKSLINDEKIQKFRQQLVFQSVQAFADLDLAPEEFLLLLAILISSSTVDGLSAKSREIIYNNSVHYSKLLFTILQTKYGVNAIKRYVPVMQLVAKAHKLKYISKTLGTYIEVFILHGKDAICQTIPKTVLMFME
ncbi:unnamed protein product [Meloidogyne enterolobii]|uniref:Uncharacterized protein n=1 Tax=Meloidogyne enterolobii TaxID=390850 RepID=A0ACB1B677_MELEN